MIRLRGHDGGICWVCLSVIGMLRGKNVAKVSCMNLRVHGRRLCPDISLFEDIVISFLLHVLDTSLCLPVIWSLLTVASKCPCNWPRVSSSSFFFVNGRFYLILVFTIYLIFFFTKVIFINTVVRRFKTYLVVCDRLKAGLHFVALRPMQPLSSVN